MTYGTQHGLPVNQVLGLGRDRKTGALVLATANGLHQFNGYEFTPYQDHPFYKRLIFLQLFSSSIHEYLLGYNLIGQLYHLGETPELLGVFKAVDIQDDYFLTIDSLGAVNYTEGSEKEKVLYGIPWVIEFELSNYKINHIDKIVYVPVTSSSFFG
jgi:hypothetical protein